MNQENMKMALFSKPTAAALTQQLGEVQAEINKLRVDIAALSDTAATDQDHHRLNVWRSRLDSALAKETRLRGEIASAVEHQRLAEQDAAFARAETISSRVTQAGAELAAVIAQIWPCVRRLIECDDKFVSAIPVRPADWDRHAFTANLLSLILSELYVASEGRLRGPTGLLQSPQQLAQNPLFTISGALREHLTMGLKARPNPQRDGLVAVHEQGGESARE
jgi:hypothetical protein